MRLWAALGAFFLAVGVAAHALDELKATRCGRGCRIGRWPCSPWSRSPGRSGSGSPGCSSSPPRSLPFVVAGAFCVVAYNLELFGGRFHTDFWFAAAWGAFPALTGFWVNALGIHSLGEAVAGRRRHRRLLRAQRRAAAALDAGARAAPQDGLGERSAAAGRRHRRGS